MKMWRRPSRRRHDQDLDEEIQSHLAMATSDRIQRGEEPHAAELAARRELGNRTLIQEITREMWGCNSIERLWQDVRYSFRGMRRSPGFTAVVILSLALGIGANTAIFSLINVLMLRLLPVQEPNQLVEFLNQYPGDPFLNAFSWQSYEHFRNNNHVFSGVTADQPSRFHVRGGGLEPETVDVDRIDGNFFQMLGVRPAIGRLIGPEDGRMGASDSAVAVVSWSFWKSRFSLDPAILGRRIFVENVPVTVIGVAPREFFGVQFGIRPDIWLPLALERMINRADRSDLSGLRLLARLKPGVPLEQARAEMAILFQWTVEERVRDSANESRRSLERQLKFAVEPAGAGLSTALREQFGKPLLALMAVVALLLLIACTNVAGILLARGAARHREMALRVSLGAGRLRLLRQVLTESLLLSAAGGLVGILFAYFGASALVGIITSGRFIGRPPQIELRVLPDMRVLLFTCSVALMAGVLFGLAPALSAVAACPASSLREAAPGETRFRRLLGKILVMGQVALSLVLLSGAGLFIRHLSNLKNRDLGFRRDHVLLMTLDTARSGFTDEQLSRACPDLLTRLEKIPGVRSATAISGPGPLSGAGAARFVTVEGHSERLEDRRYVSVSWVGPKYFETLGTPLLAGREFSFEDRGQSRIAIINEAMARYYFGASNAIGKYVTFDRNTTPYEIIGIAGNAKYFEIREATRRAIYLNALQLQRPPATFALRTSVDPQALASAARRTALDLLKNVPVARVTTLADQVDATIVPERLIALLSGVFGALASVLAAIGIYG
jgi:predicted permease